MMERIEQSGAMITGIPIKEYARSRGVSYEAVRKQVSRYHEELKDHITKKNKLQFLDDYAMDFLDQHRLERNVVIEPNDQETQAELNRLRDEIDRLRKISESRSQKIIELQETLHQKDEENSKLIESKVKAEMLLEDKQKREEELKAKDQELMDTRIKLAEAEKEAGSFHKTIFGLYRRN